MATALRWALADLGFFTTRVRMMAAQEFSLPIE
jgi:hypothetical protein